MERGLIENWVHVMLGGLYDIPVIGHVLPVALVLVIPVALGALIVIWLERKVSGRIQSRRGPMHHGPCGLCQTIWDALKLLLKEDIAPKRADRTLMFLAPVIAFIPAVLVYVVVPFGKGWIPSDLNIGVLWAAAVLSIGPVGIILGGWASNDKWSLLGGMRSAAQLISYEIPSLIALASIIMLTGSMSMVNIVDSQVDAEFILTPPGLVAFIIYLITALAEVNRTPFDLPEAESELVGGYATEYSGFKFAMFFLAEFANTIALSMIIATVFLGGWQPPAILGRLGISDSIALPGVFWFALKTFCMILVMQWVRFTLPRLRIDHMLNVCWKGLIPISLANLALTYLWMVCAPRIALGL